MNSKSELHRKAEWLAELAGSEASKIDSRPKDLDYLKETWKPEDLSEQIESAHEILAALHKAQAYLQEYHD